LDIQDTEIKEIIFYESKLTAKGPIYKVLKSIPLN
jgi:2'-5' RNA ligase